MIDTLKRLQQWYAANCNGDWEHTYGIKIENLDNPGWSVTVDLEDTYLQDIAFDLVKIQREDENDWVHCRKKDFKFDAAGGPSNLEEMLDLFLSWAEKHANELPHNRGVQPTPTSGRG